MNRYVRSNSLLEVLEQVHDLRLDRDVERRDRLVADEEVRVQRERPGEPDALALAARELVRVPRTRRPRGARPARAARGRAAPRSACRTSWIRSGSPMIRPTECRGFSDANGSWKTICIRRRMGRMLESGSAVMSCPSNTIRPAVGSYEPDDRAPERRLAAARLADEPERLAAAHVEARRRRRP